MNSQSWDVELLRFQAMTQSEQLIWLSELLCLVSMYARDTYEVGTDMVTNPVELRKFNELLHRISTFTKSVAKANKNRMSDKDMFLLLQHELPILGIAEDDLLKFLSPKQGHNS